MIIHGDLLIILACLFGIIMTWGVGANDLANIMSTTIGSKAVTAKQATFIAILFEFAGAFFGSHDVTHTIRSGIIHTEFLEKTPLIFAHGMLSVLLAGSTWMLLASTLGLPVSITHAIIGAIVGFACIVLGIHAVQWQEIGLIAISWFTSPAIAGVTAFVLFRSVQTFILGTEDPNRAARRYIPLYLLLVGMILAILIGLKGLTHFGVDVSGKTQCLIILGIGLFIMYLGILRIRCIKLEEAVDPADRFAYVEKLFSLLMAFTACAMVFAHGSNDVAIAVGPMSAVIGLVQSHGNMHLFNTPSAWILLLGCSGVILGLLMYGRKVIETVGTSITALTPSRAFAATISAASTVIVSTSIGIPVSATQTLVGAVLGVGLARGIGALNLNVIRNIFMSWTITVPAASCLAVIYYYLFHTLLS